MINFNSISNFDKDHNYEVLKKESSVEVYLVENKFILKINKRKNEYKSCDRFNIISKLNHDGFNTAKLLFYKYEDNKGYFIYEFLESKEEFVINKDNLEKLAELLNQFYEISKEIKIDSRNTLKSKLQDMSVNDNLHSKIINEIKGNISLDTKEIIHGDIVPRHIIVNDKLNIIDFDEVCLGEIEYDLGKIFNSFYLHKLSFDDNINNLNLVIEKIKIREIDLKKVFYYSMLILYQDIILADITDKEKDSKLNQILKIYEILN